MTVASTSLFAYQVRVLPKLGEKQMMVLSIFELYPHMTFTNNEIARELDWQINCVTPRVKELRQKGLIEEKEKRECNAVRTGLRVSAWGLVRSRETLF